MCASSKRVEDCTLSVALFKKYEGASTQGNSNIEGYSILFESVCKQTSCIMQNSEKCIVISIWLNSFSIREFFRRHWPFTVQYGEGGDHHYTKKWSFPLRISSVDGTKSLMKNFIFCTVHLYSSLPLPLAY